MLAVAFRADRRDVLGVTAVVAQHAPVAVMVGQRDRAVDALHALAAGAAGDEAREAAAVVQQHHLLVRFRAFRRSPSSRRRENVSCLRVSRNSCAHVDQFHFAAWDASMRSGNSSSVYLPRSTL